MINDYYNYYNDTRGACCCVSPTSGHPELQRIIIFSVLYCKYFSSWVAKDNNLFCLILQILLILQIFSILQIFLNFQICLSRPPECAWRDWAVLNAAVVLFLLYEIVIITTVASLSLFLANPNITIIIVIVKITIPGVCSGWTVGLQAAEAERSCSCGLCLRSISDWVGRNQQWSSLHGGAFLNV